MAVLVGTGMAWAAADQPDRSDRSARSAPSVPSATTGRSVPTALGGPVPSRPGGAGVDPGGPTASPTWSGAGGGARSSGGPTPVRELRTVTRGPSTRTAPRLLAAGVRSGQQVRIVSVRMSAGGARVEVRPSVGPEAARAAIVAAQADPGVVAVAVDQRVQLDAARGGADPSGTRYGAAEATGQDTYRTMQWALDALRAETAWRSSRGTGQVVAVIDSGVDGTHPDLAGQVLQGTDYVSPGGNGWADGHGHGTHVAGIVAAVAGNGLGVAGLAPGARILPIRALDSSGGGWDADIASGVIWAADHGATVVNLSLGGPDQSDPVRAAVSYALTKGVVVVAAAGNDRESGDPVEYPAGYDLPGLMAVAATTVDGVSASYSNTGPYLDLAAPGDSIISTLPGGYGRMSGTSMATPYVAAATALLRSVAPSLGPAEAAAVLIRTARDLETPGRDDDTGAGLVDPVAALCSVGHCPPAIGPTTSPTGTPTTSPTGTPTTSPTEDPSGTGTPTPTGSGPPSGVGLALRVRGPLSPVLPGRAFTLTATVTDSLGPVPGAVVIAGAAGRTVRGLTGPDGTVRLAAAQNRSLVWAVVATAAGDRVATAGLPVRVAPVVRVQWRGSRVAVTVTPAAGQQVTVWGYGAHGWVLRGRTTLGAAASRTVTLAAPSGGRARALVGAVPGLVAVAVPRA